MLETALQSGSVQALAWTALLLGFVHSILGPDHYVPFVMMARAWRWSWPKTILITALCGLGHVGSSIVIAAVLIAAGTAFSGWESTRWAALHEVRGAVAAWSLMGFGAAYAIWGVHRALRGRTHVHRHVHEDGDVHTHAHAHEKDHAHVHGSAERVTPWVLFTVFVFGPCESLIPLALAAWALGGTGAAVVTAGAFTLSTVATILVTVGLLLGGLNRIALGPVERWTHAVAGASLVACGAAIRFLGL
ncbi:MAG: hypothetical protein JXB39_05715 [Deltaproteobacteria bacterium]|nr:hypothetical protein [Deltaproteobacteria bacterium]